MTKWPGNCNHACAHALPGLDAIRLGLSSREYACDLCLTIAEPEAQWYQSRSHSERRYRLLQLH